MARRVTLPPRLSLDDYEAVAHLVPAVRELRSEAAEVVPRLQDRKVWMVNSTEHGGGVAEMLPTMITLLQELGVECEWVVIESEEQRFFDLTKRIHNMIHGAGEPGFDADDRALLSAVNGENARAMSEWVSEGDIVVVHDPQPLALGPELAAEVDILPVWRCHIGLDESTPATQSVWEFLEPFTETYLRGIFSAPEYVPGSFLQRSTVLYPAIDPLSPKNRDMDLHRTVGVLCNSALAASPGPVLTPVYPHVAQRLQLHGDFAPANMAEDIGLLSRPIVTQISRWDRLKGWAPLLEAFRLLKESVRESRTNGTDPLHARRLELVRLVLAGPDPSSGADDPEGREVLEELCAQYLELPLHVKRDVALLALPMEDPDQNALMVNAVQRASSLVAQNSIREGFGLTVTEALWKGIPVLSNRKACGPRQQVREGMDGCLVDDPEDPEALARTLNEMLADPEARKAWGQNARRRVHQHFLVFSQLRRWLQTLAEVVETRG